MGSVNENLTVENFPKGSPAAGGSMADRGTCCAPAEVSGGHNVGMGLLSNEPNTEELSPEDSSQQISGTKFLECTKGGIVSALPIVTVADLPNRLEIPAFVLEGSFYDLCIRELARLSPRHSEEGEGSIANLEESRVRTPPNERKHGRDTPASSASTLTPKRVCPEPIEPRRPEEGGTSDTPLGPPPAYTSHPDTPRSQGWGAPPPPDRVLILGAQVGLALEAIKHEMAQKEEIRNKADQELLQNVALSQQEVMNELQHTRNEVQQKMDKSLGLLESSVRAMCNDLVENVKSAVPNPPPQAPVQVEVDKAVQEASRGLETRLLDFEKHSISFFEKLSDAQKAATAEIMQTLHNAREESNNRDAILQEKVQHDISTSIAPLVAETDHQKKSIGVINQQISRMQKETQMAFAALCKKVGEIKPKGGVASANFSPLR